MSLVVLKIFELVTGSNIDIPTVNTSDIPTVTGCTLDIPTVWSGEVEVDRLEPVLDLRVTQNHPAIHKELKLYSSTLVLISNAFSDSVAD